jgi:hypothetical protein
MEDRVPISMAQTLPNPARAGQVLFAPVSRQERKGRKELPRGEQPGSALWCLAALLGDLGDLGVIRSADTPTDSHAKNAKGAKDCHEENSGFEIR